ncbi:orotidine 5'-phosphate decarboxylase [Clostridia bacterium]|nr:orotidine 5'-phosphate decarboxylase [Clostridia bacterium]
MNEIRDVIIPLDFSSGKETMAFLEMINDGIAGAKPYVKIGMELFYAEGAEFVRKIAAMGYHIFLDLKLCDIPNTVKRAMTVLKDLPIDMVNIHALGGETMIKAALEGLTRSDGTRPKLIAVTILTSISQAALNEELGVLGSVEDTCVRLALLAKRAGLDGVVCSAREVLRIHEACGADFLTVTPGVRFSDEDAGDQSRVVTPEDARKWGSDYIVVGRSITRAIDPVKAYNRYCAAFR